MNPPNQPSSMGMMPGALGGYGSPQQQQQQQQQPIITPQLIQYVMNESCLAKSALSGVMGFGMGGFFGLMMSSFSADFQLRNQVAAATGSQAQSLSDLPFKQQLKFVARDMGQQSWRMAKNFGFVGAIYAGVECWLQSAQAGGYHASSSVGGGSVYASQSAAADKTTQTPADPHKHWLIPVEAGCLTGGWLARHGGPNQAVGGCMAFAAFSAAIEYWQHNFS